MPINLGKIIKETDTFYFKNKEENNATPNKNR